MSAKTKITIAILLLFIPIILGIAHRIYYHGKDSLIWKRKEKPINNYKQNPENVYRGPVQEIEVRESAIKDAPAQFFGGNEALERYIKDAVIYPESQTLRGKVYIKMRIDEQGYPFDIVVTKGLGKVFDEEAVRVVKNMPAWEPQIKNYQIVKSDLMYIQIPFEKPKTR